MKKIALNFGLASYEALGLYQYIISILVFLTSLPQIFKTKDLSLFDKKYGQLLKWVSIKHRFGRIKVPVKHIDREVQEESYSFGAVRELMIRDCYFKHHLDLNPGEIKTVIDLGGNRGLFNTVCSSFATKIIIVEFLKKYLPVIKYNLNANPFSNFAIENKYIGEKGQFESRATDFITFQEVLDKHNISRVDFLKVDIEGAEFSLFDSNFPIEKVKYVSMEVHPQYGSLQSLVDYFEKNEFEVKVANKDLILVSNSNNFDFLYAKNSKL